MGYHPCNVGLFREEAIQRESYTRPSIQIKVISSLVKDPLNAVVVGAVQ